MHPIEVDTNILIQPHTATPRRSVRPLTIAQFTKGEPYRAYRTVHGEYHIEVGSPGTPFYRQMTGPSVPPKQNVIQSLLALCSSGR